MAKKTTQYYEAIGRRKSAVARVRLYLPEKAGSISLKGVNVKKGEMVVNSKHVKADDYFVPLRLTENDKRFAVSIVVKGGGKTGQLEAIVHGLARALEKIDKNQYRSTLKKAGLLTRDARVKERRKVGRGGKARKQKQSPKR